MTKTGRYFSFLQRIRILAKRIAVQCIIAGALLCAATNAHAADDDWRFSITPYLWLPSVNASQNVSEEPIEVNTSTEGYDIVRNLDFALLGTGEIARGKLGFIFDFQTIKLANDGSVGIEGNKHEFDTELTIADGTFALEYRLIDQPKFSLDGFGGARVVYGKSKIDIHASGSVAGISGEGSKTWIDPIVGLKARYHLTDKWSLGAYGDVGGFVGSSTITYQLVGTVNYSFTKHIALNVGYRYWFDKFEQGDFKLDASLYGPVIGLTFAF